MGRRLQQKMLEVGWWGSSRDLSKSILKQGVVKGKNCSKGEGGFEGGTTPAPPQKILIVHYVTSNSTSKQKQEKPITVPQLNGVLKLLSILYCHKRNPVSLFNNKHLKSICTQTFDNFFIG